jgi:hypothetical protein
MPRVLPKQVFGVRGDRDILAGQDLVVAVLPPVDDVPVLDTELPTPGVVEVRVGDLGVGLAPPATRASRRDGRYGAADTNYAERPTDDVGPERTRVRARTSVGGLTKCASAAGLRPPATQRLHYLSCTHQPLSAVGARRCRR